MGRIGLKALFSQNFFRHFGKITICTPAKISQSFPAAIADNIRCLNLPVIGQHNRQARITAVAKIHPLKAQQRDISAAYLARFSKYHIRVDFISQKIRQILYAFPSSCIFHLDNLIHYDTTVAVLVRVILIGIALFGCSLTLVLKDYVQKDRKSTRLNSSHSGESRMPSSA